jgi:hypothetical protein
MPFKNKVAVGVMIFLIPLSIIVDSLSWIKEKLSNFIDFIARWMENWTGINK